MMKRLLSLLLAAWMLTLSLVSCGEQFSVIDVLAGGDCQVIYDGDLLSKERANELAEAIKAATGTEIVAVSRSSLSQKPTPSASTILVGNLDLDPCSKATKGLRVIDYAVGMYDGCLVIGATSDSALLLAIAYFTETVLPKYAKHGSLPLSERINLRYEGSYELQNVSIGGVPLTSFEIVTPVKPSASEYRVAVLLQKLLRDRAGYEAERCTVKQTTAQGKFLIGEAADLQLSQENSFCALVGEGTLTLTANTPNAYEALLNYLENELLRSASDTLTLAAGLEKRGNGAAPSCEVKNQGEIRLMTHNVWGSGGTGHGQRMRMLLELYAIYMPDVICLQEFSPDMRAYAEAALMDLGYREVATNPGDVYYNKETQTRTPVFYNTATMEQLSSGYNCLAVMDYGKYPELLGEYTADQLKAAARADRSKAVTWGILRAKATGKALLVASTHLWWRGGAVDDAARVLQMRELREVLTKAAADHMTTAQRAGQLPIFIGGDFNSRSTRPSYATMSNGLLPFVNLNDLASEAHKLQKTTSRGYPVYDKELKLWTEYIPPKSSYKSAIDHWFVDAATAASVTVNYLALCEDDYAYLSSDHTPILADITL